MEFVRPLSTLNPHACNRPLCDTPCSELDSRKLPFAAPKAADDRRRGIARQERASAGRKPRPMRPSRCRYRAESAPTAARSVHGREAPQLAGIEGYTRATECRQAILRNHFTRDQAAISCGFCDSCRSEVDEDEQAASLSARPRRGAAVRDIDAPAMRPVPKNLRE